MNELGNTPADKNYKPSGISRAEEMALEAFPNMTFAFTPLDLNAYRREAFIQGYEAAEKDLALTAEDIRTIYELTEKVSNHSVWAKYSSGFWDEVLKRFKEAKNED